MGWVLQEANGLKVIWNKALAGSYVFSRTSRDSPRPPRGGGMQTVQIIRMEADAVLDARDLSREDVVLVVELDTRRVSPV